MTAIALIAAATTAPEGAALGLAICQGAHGAARAVLAHCVSIMMGWLLGRGGEGVARLTGQVIAVDGGLTTARPLAKGA